MKERAPGTALITGANGGLGREFAGVLAERGFDLVLTGRNRAELETLRRELAQSAVHVVAADLSVTGGTRTLVDYLEQVGLSVEVLVNNAGFGDLGRFVESNPDRQLEMIRVNVAALVDLTRSLAPPMVDAGRGHILNVASTAGFAPGSLMSVYYATKAFVVSFSLALSEELRGTGVSVCTLCPGAIRTRFDQVAGAAEGEGRRRRMDPRRVALAGIEGMLRGKRLVVPGVLNKMAVQTSRFLPRTTLVRYLARFNDRKTK